MPWFWVSLAVALETRAAASGNASLATAAAASPRPRECRGAVAGEDGLWARARAGDVQRYCELLARGYARLTEAPAAALAAAEAAETFAGPTALTRVLNGRAKLRLGRAPAALEQFVEAEAQDAQAFLDPKALHDYARAASLGGKPLEAVRLYRMLVSRSALLDDARERTVVQIETAAHVLAYVQGGSDEALGYLAQARRSGLGLGPWITGLRLLTAERNGRGVGEPGAGAAPSLTSLTQPLAAGNGGPPLLPPGELDALAGALLEPTDASESRRHWQLFASLAVRENVWLAQSRKPRAESAPRGKSR